MIKAERLRELLSYDPETGVFTRLISTSSTAIAGTQCGSLDVNGYLKIKIEGKDYYCHRLAFLYVSGECPSDQIDHINNNPSDNRWLNLRPANNSQNHANIPKTKANSSGFKGVAWNKKARKWQAQIMVSGKNIYLGLFPSPEMASGAYNAAAERYFGEFARK